MKTRTLLAALALTVAPTLALAMGCSGHDTTAQSCVAGTVWDGEKGACVPQTTS